MTTRKERQPASRRQPLARGHLGVIAIGAAIAGYASLLVVFLVALDPSGVTLAAVAAVLAGVAAAVTAPR